MRVKDQLRRKLHLVDLCFKWHFDHLNLVKNPGVLCHTTPDTRVGGSDQSSSLELKNIQNYFDDGKKLWRIMSRYFNCGPTWNLLMWQELWVLTYFWLLDIFQKPCLLYLTQVGKILLQCYHDECPVATEPVWTYVKSVTRSCSS